MSAPAVSISGVLRVAVLASSPAEQGRLAALVGQCGHRIVGPGASPDAVLTDGTAAATLPAAAVAIGAVNEAFAGLLPPDAAAAQVDAALRAVAAGLIVRTPALPPRTFEWLPDRVGLEMPGQHRWAGDTLIGDRNENVTGVQVCPGRRTVLRDTHDHQAARLTGLGL